MNYALLFDVRAEDLSTERLWIFVTDDSQMPKFTTIDSQRIYSLAERKTFPKKIKKNRVQKKIFAPHPQLVLSRSLAKRAFKDNVMLNFHQINVLATGHFPLSCLVYLCAMFMVTSERSNVPLVVNELSCF
jgi:hypothetical protein